MELVAIPEEFQVGSGGRKSGRRFSGCQPGQILVVPSRLESHSAPSLRQPHSLGTPHGFKQVGLFTGIFKNYFPRNNLHLRITETSRFSPTLLSFSEKFL